ncbi:MAG: CD1871A family CXXC motif-containing protein [Lachnospiraceae bacterium]|nr:CD1871A family CXXC motif-containing protein [Lachnospiraceae bacterium]
MKNLTNARWIGPCLAAVGLAMVIFGISRGEMNVVFTKAINICMECIGIG